MAFCARYLLEHLAEVEHECEMRGQTLVTLTLADLKSLVVILRDVDKRNGNRADDALSGQP
ncbi:unnamed protein product [marine sediment metagenome]|uniref:Uncharacterized protein n=1 Tax=marine sediment metagenome TaxID=412755 RepID=X0V9X9_9ZZZZ